MSPQIPDSAYQAALDEAGRQLSYRGLSAQALRDKLAQKGHSEEAADFVVAYLTERGLLDDARFAQAAAHSYQRRGYGAARIRQELRRRGVSREDADAALADFTADLDTLQALLDKKLHGDLSDPKQIQRAIAFLQRRGFGWAEIRAALQAYGAARTDEPD